MAAVGCPVGAQRQSQRRVCIRFGLLFYRRKQLVALLPVAPEMRQLKVGKVAGMPALGHGNDVVDARRKRMRKLAAEIHRFAADAAHGLCSIDLLLLRSKARRCVPSRSGRVTVFGICGSLVTACCAPSGRSLCRQGDFFGEGVFSKPMGALQARGYQKSRPEDPNGRRFAVSAQLPAAAACWAGWNGTRLAVCCHALRMMLQ